jgi:exodeoxyribonuclease VII large subunit
MASRRPPAWSSFRKVRASAFPESGALFDDGSRREALSVSAFVAKLNATLRATLPGTWVKGEAGEWKVWSSGHAYFSLKDDAATLPAVMWADDVRRLKFRVEAGMELLAFGRPNFYPPTGKFSFVVSELEPVGIGALQVAFEQLKAKLQAEGLFAMERKRPLPVLPARIGLVTSRHGAAVRDVLKVLSVRFPNAHVTIYPVAVQGAGAPAEIARAVRAFSARRAADVVIVARGGGSKEDLAAFNDEKVVRAVAASSIPTVSAVGHEVDVTLTDLVADVRAATPSQAAELVVGRREEFERLLVSAERMLQTGIRTRLGEAGAELSSLVASSAFAGFPSEVARRRLEVEGAARRLSSAVRQLPAVLGERLGRCEGRLLGWPDRIALAFRRESVSREEGRLVDKMREVTTRAGERLGLAAGRLSALDPLKVLSRGYAVAYRGGESVPLTDPAVLVPGDPLRVRLARGEVDATVVATRSLEDEGGRRGNETEKH